MSEDKTPAWKPSLGNDEMSKRTRNRIEQIGETCTALQRVEGSIEYLRIRYRETETEPTAIAAADELFRSNIILQNSIYYRLCRDYQRLKDFLATATLNHPRLSVDFDKLNDLRDTLTSVWSLVSMFKITVLPKSTPDDQINAAVEQYSPNEPLHDYIWNLATLTNFVLERENIFEICTAGCQKSSPLH